MKQDVVAFMAEHTPVDILNLRQGSQADEYVKSGIAKQKKAIGLVQFTAEFDTSLLVKSLGFSLRSKVLTAEVREYVGVM